MQIRAIVGVTLMLLLAPLIAAEAAEKRIPTTFKSIRWQMLQGAIRSVVVGPDGRIWYQLDSDPKDRPREEIRKSLEAEYRQTNPQIIGAALALLEPSGRAWFSANKGAELWGFDGKIWIERRTEKGAKFSGVCPTRGQFLDNLCNRFVGGRAWFRDEQGIHVFDGKTWHYRAIGPPNTAILPKSAIPLKSGVPANNIPLPNKFASLNTNVTELIRFAVSPNGKFAVALAPKYAWELAGLKNPDVWFWKDSTGIWQKRQFSWNDKQGAVGSFCIADDGTMWCAQSGQIRKFLLGNAGDVLDRLPALLDELDSDDFATREKAHASLSSIAEQVQPQIAAALESATSPEKKRRLTALLEQIREFTLRMGVRPGEGLLLGDYRVPNASSVFQDDASKLYLFSGSIVDRTGQIDQGFLVIDPNGSVKRYSFGSGKKSVYGGGSVGSPVMAAKGNALWVTRAGPESPFISRYDLASQKVTAFANDGGFHSIRAIDNQDRAYTAPHNYNPLDGREQVLGFLSPAIPEGQGALPIERRPAERQYAVAPDGVIWASDRKEGLIRYGGGKWELVHAMRDGPATPILAGCQGYVLCVSGNDDYRLFRDKELIGSGPLRRLIANHRQEFLTAFPPMFTPVQPPRPLWIASDSANNIWLSNSHEVAVFCRYEWLETTDARNAAKIMTNGTGSQVVSAVGYGNKVYFNSVLAKVADDRVIIEQAPTAPQGSNVPVGYRDKKGGLWLPSYRGSTGRYSPENFCTIYLTDQGANKELPVNGWPVLLDQSENLWLAEMGISSPSNHFWIWKNGAIVQELTIPGSDEHFSMFSDVDGSVFVKTKWGLHHLVADQDGQFQLKDTHVLPPLKLVARGGHYSEYAGFIVSATTNGIHELCFIGLPES